MIFELLILHLSPIYTNLYIMTQGETQMHTQEADGWSLTMFINPKGVGKRMVVARQKVKTGSESMRFRVADRLVVKEGRMVRQAGTISKTGKGQNQED